MAAIATAAPAAPLPPANVQKMAPGRLKLPVPQPVAIRMHVNRKIQMAMALKGIRGSAAQ